MGVRATLLSAVLVAMALGSASCIGDRSTAVTIVNDATIEVSVYPFGRDYPDWKRTLAGGQSFSTSWLIGDGTDDTFVARVEAYDVSGKRVFCHGYRFGELKKLGGKVRIVAGTGECT
jgi:hypothetical protein